MKFLIIILFIVLNSAVAMAADCYYSNIYSCTNNYDKKIIFLGLTQSKHSIEGTCLDNKQAQASFEIYIKKLKNISVCNNPTPTVIIAYTEGFDILNTVDNLELAQKSLQGLIRAARSEDNISQVILLNTSETLPSDIISIDN